MKHNQQHKRPTIGVLAGWQFAWTETPLSYLAPIFQGVCQAGRDLGCNVLLGCGMGAWTHERDALRPAWPQPTAESDFVPIGPWNTDGLIAINPLHTEARARYLQELMAAGHPVIFIAAGEAGPAVLADNRSGIHAALQHLVAHGHRRIAFISGSPEDMEGDTGERLHAYHEAITAHDLVADPRLIVCGRHIYAGGYTATRELLASGVHFTAMLASNDESALGAMQALREAGRHISQDVALIGFDDRPESAVQQPPLSSVRVPLSQMGYQAAESLFRYLTGQTATIESHRVPTQLAVRASCGCGEDATRLPERHAVPAQIQQQTNSTPANPVEFQAALDAAWEQQRHALLVNQRWMLNHLGTLTARLLAALDEAQIYAVLAEHLPAMGIHSAWIAVLAAEGDDSVAWTTLRALTAPEMPPRRFQSRAFPPPELLPTADPFSLALFPLTGPSGQLGYVIFDTTHLELYGAIAQQLATALHSAQLYREATEGRRLAEEANALKSRFLSTVSHELRTPLNLIVGLTGMLLQESDTPLPRAYRQDVEHIHANAQLLGGLIGDVLDLASSDAGQLRLIYDHVDLSETLRLIVETGRKLAHEKGLAWYAILPPSGPWVWGDKTRLRQVVLNLINNAIKFTAQGQVSLTLESGPDAVTVTVTDTGLGIPPNEQSLIFDEFRRSERSMAQGYSGLGLGLAICKRLIAMHNGVIGVQSAGEEGAGATVYFTLPTVTPPEIPARTLPQLTSESILVLTHRAGHGARLREHLQQRGFEVHIAFMDEMPDWLTQLASTPPGAIVIDVSTLPQQAWHVLKSIKAHPQNQHLPVLFCSLSADGGAVLEFDYLTKPIEITELTRAMDQQWLLPSTGHAFKTILVVDDDPETLEMHARIVQTHSSAHRVLRARNGLEALGVLQQETVDLVLLDLMMPKIDGFEVLKTMRAEETTRQIPVIVLTGQVLTETDMARLNQGVATVLRKGMFSPEETLLHIGSTLERHRKLSAEAQRLVRQAMAYIHEHYAEPLSRADIARHVALSEDYLTFCFRKELRVTPIVYLNRFRIHQAQRLLTETTTSIAQIAAQVGFSDSSYFSRVFRREVGLSPEAYRQH